MVVPARPRPIRRPPRSVFRQVSPGFSLLLLSVLLLVPLLWPSPSLSSPSATGRPLPAVRYRYSARRGRTATAISSSVTPARIHGQYSHGLTSEDSPLAADWKSASRSVPRVCRLWS